MTKQVSDKKMLLETMKEHFNKRGLPISLYSASGFERKETNCYVMKVPFVARKIAKWKV